MTSLATISVINDYNTASFARIKSDNVLLEVSFVSLNLPMPFDGGGITYTYKSGDKEIQVAAKDLELWRNKADYLAGKDPLPIVNKALREHGYSHAGKFAIQSSGDNEIEFLSWTMKNLVPTQVPTPLVALHIDMVGYIAPEFMGGTDTTLYYATREQALQYNDFQYTDKDGVVRQQEGTHAFLKLNSIQQIWFDSIKDTLKKLKEVGVILYFDTRDGSLLAINGERAYIDWDDCRRDDIEYVPLDEIHPDQVITDAIYCTNSDEPDYKVIKKEENKQ